MTPSPIAAPATSPLPLDPRVLLGDCRDSLASLPDGSVDLSIWSPPYHVGKNYEAGQSFDQWQQLLRDVLTAHARLLKPGGFCVINIADILALPDETLPRIQAATAGRGRSDISEDAVRAAAAAHPEWNRRQLAALLGCSEQTIDRRLNGNNIRGGKQSAQTRVHLVGGDLQEAALAAGLYLYDRRAWVKDAAWANCQWHSSSYRAVDEFEYVYVFAKPGVVSVDRSRLSPEEWGQWGSRGVWTIPSVRANDDHEAKFPPELVRRIVRLLSEPGDLVIDPFVGSGTTVCEAARLGRRVLGCELLPEYARLTSDRLSAI